MNRVTIICGDALAVLRTLPAESVHCVVTSPPYWALRDYGVPGQIGLERTPEEYVEKLAEVFHEVHRVLRGNGTLWLNIGYTYDGKGNLIDIPCMLRDRLIVDNWYCKAPIVWHKPNALPTSVEKRPTMAHEMIWLLAKHKNTDYYYDAESVKEPAVTTRPELLQFGPRPERGYPGHVNDRRRRKSKGDASSEIPTTRNRRSVWTIATRGYTETHFATFPPKLPEICIKAGCPPGGLVLDPFGGTGTTGMVAARLLRDAILIELNPRYCDMAARRIKRDGGMFVTIERRSVNALPERDFAALDGPRESDQDNDGSLPLGRGDGFGSV